jgi:hypothetical protein
MKINKGCLWKNPSIVNSHMAKAGSSRFKKCSKQHPCLSIEKFWWDLEQNEEYTTSGYSYHMDQVMFDELRLSKTLRETTLKIMAGKYPDQVTPVKWGFCSTHYYLDLENPSYKIFFLNLQNNFPGEPLVSIRKSDNSDGVGFMLDIPSLFRFLNLPDLENFKIGLVCSCQNNLLLSTDEVDCKKGGKK